MNFCYSVFFVTTSRKSLCVSTISRHLRVYFAATSLAAEWHTSHLPMQSLGMDTGYNDAIDAVLCTDGFRDGLASRVLGSGRMYAAFIEGKINVDSVEERVRFGF